MSIYIKGMEMPKDCTHCPCYNDDYDKCRAPGCWDKGFCCWDDRPDWCPLIELPKHGRLIDADAKVQTQFYDDEHKKWTVIEMTVDEYLGYCYNKVPTIIPASEDGE